MFKLLNMQFLKLMFLLVIPLSQTFERKCDQLGIHFYEAIGCEVNQTRNCCPISYNCPINEIRDGFCMVAGKYYRDGEDIEGTSNCITCTCDLDDAGIPPLQCFISDCMPLKEQPGCYEKRDLNTCCPTELYCPNKTSATCVVDGKRYTENQKINPKDSCWECICKKDFKLFQEPFCRRIRCDLGVWDYAYLEKKCTPFYTKQIENRALCCPSGYICDYTTISVDDTNISSPSSDVKCNFGGMTFPLQSKFTVDFTYNTENNTATCECLVAPYPTCIVA